MTSKGYTLVFILIIASILLGAGIALAKICILSSSVVSSAIKGTSAFYLAEGGIEYEKSKLTGNYAWYTDKPHADYDKSWLIKTAAGNIYLLGTGGFKIVKEQTKNRAYSVGFIGNDINSSEQYCFLKMQFQMPFKQTGWERF